MTNSVVLMGRLTDEPEVNVTARGSAVLNFTLAVTRGVDLTDFIDCTAWENTAKLIEKFATKGGRIAVTGSIETRNWQDSNGNKRKSTTVRVSDFSVIDFKDKGNERQNAPQRAQGTQTEQAPIPEPPADDLDLPELPF